MLQSQSAGIDALLNEISDFLSQWLQEFVGSRKDLGSAQVIIKNDSAKRTNDGLEIEKAKVLSGSAVGKVQIRVGSQNHENLLVDMFADLSGGQKTGFFLDQSFNIDVVYELVLRSKKRSVRILDICSYVGQWSAKLSKGLQSQGVKVECVALDASAAALEMTQKNVETNGGVVECRKLDVFKSSWNLEPQSFDIVICDPPALIKNRKDIEVGKHGYSKINLRALQMVACDGFIVGCSCSGALGRKDFRKTLDKAVQKSARNVLWVSEGRQSPDHPIRDWFPEGEYLKCSVGRLLN